MENLDAITEELGRIADALEWIAESFNEGLLNRAIPEVVRQLEGLRFR